MPNKPIGYTLTDAEVNAMVRDVANASLDEEMLLGESIFVEKRALPEVIAPPKQVALPEIAAIEKAQFVCAASSTASEIESKWISNGKKFGLQEYRAAKLSDNSFKLQNISKGFIRESVIPQLKQHCELWGKRFVEFMDSKPQALKLLSEKITRQVQNKFDWHHMFVPELKRGGVSGYHLIDYVPEGVIEVVKEHARSLDIIAGVENTVKRVFKSQKTLFLPGTTEQEVIRLFHDVCMNLDKWAELNGGSRVVRSKEILGQCYEIIVDKAGEIKTFYPTNQKWKY